LNSFSQNISNAKNIYINNDTTENVKDIDILFLDIDELEQDQ
jgi:hypothetical protein